MSEQSSRHYNHSSPEFDEAAIVEALRAEIAGSGIQNEIADHLTLSPNDIAAEIDSVKEVIATIGRVRDTARQDTERFGSKASTRITNDRSSRSAEWAGGPSAPATVDAAVLDTLGQVGRFSILRQLGAGGYGLVFLAHDNELDRDVALKVPRPEVVLTNELRTRFLREGKTAALLSHPNIVSVFESGRTGSVCFIISQYVEGITLAQWLAAEHRMNQQSAARLMASLADAVQHAHSKGVVHRDLKPANIILDQSAQDPPANQLADCARITDFGLARMIDDQNALTRSGAIVGTPSYMSPEQAHGTSPVGASTDIYSLGAILYELLAGIPPFSGDSVLQTLRQLQEKEPTALRRIVPEIEPDLESICLKCLEKQPAQRYPSAAALYADLTRYLHGEPVLARPVTIARRFQKWCRRNPVIATFSAVFAISGIAAVVALASLWLRSEQHRSIAETKSSQLTRSIQSLFTILATSPEIRAPAAEPLRRRVVEQAEQVFASIVEETSDDARMRFDQANSIYEVAQILDAMGTVSEALQKTEVAIAISEALDEQFIGGREHETIGNWQVFKGHLQTKLGDFAGANESFAEGLAHYKEFEAGNHDETSSNSIQPYMASGQAHALAQQAMGAIQAKDVRGAIGSSKKCEDIWRTLAKHESMGSQTDNIRFAMAHSFLILGQVYEVSNELAKSEQLLSEAIEIAESIDSVAVSAQVGARGILAACYHRYGIALARQEKYDEARAAYEDSLTRFEQLVHDFPDVARYREFQSSARYSLAFTEYLCKNYEVARHMVNANIDSHRQLITQFPETAGLYWDRVGDNYNVIAMMVGEDPNGRTDDRVQALQAAISAYEESLALQPDWKEPVVGWADVQTQLAATLRDHKPDFAAAETHLVAAIDRLESIDPDSAWHASRATLASAQYEFAKLLDAQGELELAIQRCERGLTVLRHPDTKEIVLELARLLAKAGRLDEAEREIRGYVDELATAPPDNDAARDLCLAIAEELSEDNDRQRFRDLAEFVDTVEFSD